MKGMLAGGGDENMSNITTSAASNEANSLSSSSNRNEIGTIYPSQPHSHSFASSLPNNIIHSQSQPTSKRKRNLPGNPDPEAEVIALSPKSLMATNRFLCEICNKGFQRDQNLQLHRRGHNLPWKLKQRSNKEVIKKKVYVCPETTCVHNDPSRALGDLTGIKKHFSRKHGEKKWKCEKCSKRYAVQSDWKAHSKICGTREYRCDCGTLFSRRDSFITHRAFCDALAEESARSSSLIPTNNHHHPPPLHLQNLVFPLKTEQTDHQQDHPQNITSFNLMRPPHDHLPPWLNHQNQNPNPNNINNSNINHFLSSSSSSCSPHMSATALLQKAAQMGVTMSKPSHTTTVSVQSMFGSHQTHMCTPTAGSVLGLSTSDQEMGSGGHIHHDGNFVNVTSGSMDQVGPPPPHNNNSLFDHHIDMVRNSLTSTNGFEGTTFEEAFNGMLSSRRDQEGATSFQEALLNTIAAKDHQAAAGSSGNEELTRDFLGLRGFPDHRQHFLNMAAGLDHMATSSPFHHHHNQTPWQGN